MRTFLRQNSLSLFFLAIFLASLFGQAVAGNARYNNDQRAHHGSGISLGRYVTSSTFARETAENWQSEFLQFSVFTLATIWFIQRGSPESKPEDEAGLETDEQQKIGRHATKDSPLWARVGGLRTAIYSNSLMILMTIIFLGSLFAQSVSGWSEYNADQLEHTQPELSYWGYVGSADFWDNALQNWQSEFLAIGSFAVFTIYLRQRGSPESKPVGAPHDATGVEG
jgi:hypothetical protein